MSAVLKQAVNHADRKICTHPRYLESVQGVLLACSRRETCILQHHQQYHVMVGTGAWPAEVERCWVYGF